MLKTLGVCLVTVFFLLFSVSKNNFLFLRIKNLFGNPKWTGPGCLENQCSVADRMVWSLTPNGSFSTSSAYKLLTNPATSGSAGSTALEPQKRFWNGVWQLRVPNKIKHFIWRACNNALPAKCNLARRRIVNSDLCDLRNRELESSLYALWQCNEVAAMWASCHWFQATIHPPPLSFCDLLDRFLQVSGDYRKELFAMVTWSLWNRRNSIHFGWQAHPLSHICTVASSLLQEFLATQMEEQTSVSFAATMAST